MANENEKLGPAERIIKTVLEYTDHMIHNRPGVVSPDASSPTGVKWTYTKWKLEDGVKVAYRQDKGPMKRIAKGKGKGKSVQSTVPVRIGTIDSADIVHADNGTRIGVYRSSGLFKEVAVYLYKQVAEIYKLDHEFTAKWASYAYMQEHQDMKVVLAAFMLVQARKGDPVLGENGKEEFRDLDFRDVGEAMILQNIKNSKGEEIRFDAKHLLRIFDLLSLPEIAQINRDLGFSTSRKNPQLGRWSGAVRKWLNFRQHNPKLLKGLIKSGQRSSVMKLAELSGFKPETSAFFSALRWKQTQAKDGRRVVLGETVKAAETWNDLTEEQICEKISREKPGYKVIGTLVPTSIGMTPAIMAAAIQNGCLSDKDLIIATPTIEELGLLKHPDTKARWDAAMKKQDNMRAANIAKRVVSKETKEALQDAAETALKEQVKEVVKGLRVYFIVDKSGSMEGAIEAAKESIKKCLPAFPLDQLHVSVFNTEGTEVKIRFATSAGVENAFKGISAGGGTSYGEGVRALSAYKPKPDEDSLFIFVGDEGDMFPHFADAVRASGLNPVAFGLIPVTSPRYGRGDKVRVTAQRLGIPCFEIDDRVFADPYAIPRTMRNMIAATPVNRVDRVAAPVRVTLVETILKTALLVKPAWSEPISSGNQAAE